jgi:hypothetical protein
MIGLSSVVAAPAAVPRDANAGVQQLFSFQGKSAA